MRRTRCPRRSRRRRAGRAAGVAAARAERGDTAPHAVGHAGRHGGGRARRAVERAKPAGSDIPKIAGGVHQLVVAEQHDERATRGAGLGLEPGDQVEDRALVVAAIEHVAGLDDDERAADPAIVVVDRTGGAQRRTRGGEVAVEIADRDQALGSRQPQRQRGDRAARGGRTGRRRRRGHRSLVVPVPSIAGERKCDQPDDLTHRPRVYASRPRRSPASAARPRRCPSGARSAR